MSIQAVVFDIGGVLEINRATGWPERWAARLGMELDVFESVVSAVGAPGATGAASLAEIEERTAADLEVSTSPWSPSSWRTCGPSTWEG